MQPTTSCNLDCRYCYLPGRAAIQRMPVRVATRVARTVNEWAEQGRGVPVYWHGGEPLMTGRERLAALLAPFRGVTHAVQTNATLIDDRWCGFLIEHQIRVGVSIDGPAELDADRRTRSHRPAHDRILSGIAHLRRHGIAFTALAVQPDPDPERAAELYRFFVELGASAVGVSIEAPVGANRSATPLDPVRVRDFWIALTEAWLADPVIRIREIDDSLRAVRHVLMGPSRPDDVDPLPTITHDGNVVLVAPELAGFRDRRYHDFGSGNVLDTELHTILSEASGRTPWLDAHLRCVDHCREQCEYAQFCVGPSPASSYFERGLVSPGPTAYCRTSVMSRADALSRPMLAAARRSA